MTFSTCTCPSEVPFVSLVFSASPRQNADMQFRQCPENERQTGILPQHAQTADRVGYIKLSDGMNRMVLLLRVKLEFECNFVQP